MVPESVADNVTARVSFTRNALLPSVVGDGKATFDTVLFLIEKSVIFSVKPLYNQEWWPWRQPVVKIK